LLDHIKRFSFPGGQLQSASWFVMSWGRSGRFQSKDRPQLIFILQGLY
jgi:hypothetical protein